MVWYDDYVEEIECFLGGIGFSVVRKNKVSWVTFYNVFMLLLNLFFCVKIYIYILTSKK